MFLPQLIKFNILPEISVLNQVVRSAITVLYWVIGCWSINGYYLRIWLKVVFYTTSCLDKPYHLQMKTILYNHFKYTLSVEHFKLHTLV